MAVVKELIRTEENGAISFGDYELAQKSKLSDYQHQGDMNLFRELQYLVLFRVRTRWISMWRDRKMRRLQ